MVLTHYVAHVLIAMAILEVVGILYSRPIWFAVTISLVWFAFSVVFSVFWLKYFKKGPLEILMRKISG